jgi:hypothetical protein
MGKGNIPSIKMIREDNGKRILGCFEVEKADEESRKIRRFIHAAFHWGRTPEGMYG